MSHHNGSVPHDNAMIATGLARYGWLQRRRSSGMFDAATYMDLRRL
jgi:glycogen debranching enzyme